MLKTLRLLLCPLLGFAGTVTADSPRWVVYYNNLATYEQLRPYNPLVFDSHTHPSLRPFMSTDVTTLAYLSLGEVATHNPYFEEVKAQGLLLGENPNWPGSYFVDVRSPKWTKRVIENLIPAILFKRFKGIFLDTLDNADFLEDEDPIKYKGMREAAIRLVKAIRRNYPQIPIMLNRALDIAPSIITDVDMVLGESVLTNYDVGTKKYGRVAKKDYDAYVDRLKKLEQENPRVTIYTLDYWDPEDSKGIEEIYRIQRENGFIPYVATRDLQTIVPEPVLVK